MGVSISVAQLGRIVHVDGIVTVNVALSGGGVYSFGYLTIPRLFDVNFNVQSSTGSCFGGFLSDRKTDSGTIKNCLQVQIKETVTKGSAYRFNFTYIAK